MWHVHTVGFCSTVRKSEIMNVAGKCMEREKNHAEWGKPDPEEQMLLFSATWIPNSEARCERHIWSNFRNKEGEKKLFYRANPNQPELHRETLSPLIKEKKATGQTIAGQKWHWHKGVIGKWDLVKRRDIVTGEGGKRVKEQLHLRKS